MNLFDRLEESARALERSRLAQAIENSVLVRTVQANPLLNGIATLIGAAIVLVVVMAILLIGTLLAIIVFDWIFVDGLLASG